MDHRIDRVYTKVGDGGLTLLAMGEKVKKTSLRISAYGSVDELNSSIGIFRDSLPQDPFFEELTRKLILIQNELFNIGGELSFIDSTQNRYPLTCASIERLEAEIDEFNELLPPLKNFVLPGGHPCNSNAHFARTLCRRAEIQVLKLSENSPVRKELCIFLNRLSDWLFVVARRASFELSIEETLWQPDLGGSS